MTEIGGNFAAVIEGQAALRREGREWVCQGQ